MVAWETSFAARQLRPPNHSAAAGAQRHQDDHDLPANRSQRDAEGGQKPAGLPLITAYSLFLLSALAPFPPDPRAGALYHFGPALTSPSRTADARDRKSTRLNSS